jgi:DNA-binding transcriptional MerR regulator
MEPMPPELGESSPASLPVAMLTVAAVARRLGVAPATLRTWDRRYGLGPSGHTCGAHRRYGPGDLARLEAMRRLTRAGVSPAEAARVASAAGAAAVTADDMTAPTARRPTVETDDADAAALDGSGRPGGGRVIAMPSSSRAARGLGRAAMALDSPAATAIVCDALAMGGVVWTWEQVVLPVLGGIGRRWAATGQGVEVEHLLSECVIWAIGHAVPLVEHPVNARPVLLAAAENELHTLPLFALSGALAERRIASRVLGARLPATALADAVRRSGPAAVFVWSQLPATGDPSAIEALPSLRPAPLLVVGGPGWDGAPAGTVVATDLSSAADLIAVAVGA